MTRRVVALAAVALVAGIALGVGGTFLMSRDAGVGAPSSSSSQASSQAPLASSDPTASAIAGGQTPGSSASPSGAPSPSQPPYNGPVTRLVPVLMYHLISDPPPGAPYPGLYVSAASFDAQMHALHDAGWHTITAGELGADFAANRPVPVRTFVVMFDDGYVDNLTTAMPILQKYGFVGTVSIVAAGGHGMLSSPQLAQLIAGGMEIGNHTLNHKNVATLSGALLTQQIAGGAQEIEARLASQGINWVPQTFVYPSGHVGSAAVALLRQLGYTDAFTEGPGVAQIGISPPLQIPRIRVSRGETLADFLSRMPTEPPRP